MDLLDRPWHAVKFDDAVAIDGKNLANIIIIARPGSKEDSAMPGVKNLHLAKFIVKACNNHDELTAALKAAKEELEYLKSCSIKSVHGDYIDMNEVVYNQVVEVLRKVGENG